MILKNAVKSAIFGGKQSLDMGRGFTVSDLASHVNTPVKNNLSTHSWILIIKSKLEIIM